MTTTREQVLNEVRARGQASITELAECLGVTPVAVRHHVAALQGRGDGLGLDGGRRGVTCGGDRFEGSGAQPELGKLHVV